MVVCIAGGLPMSQETTAPANKDVRALSTEEIDAVSGGHINTNGGAFNMGGADGINTNGGGFNFSRLAQSGYQRRELSGLLSYQY
jgi:hypothetical protein